MGCGPSAFELAIQNNKSFKNDLAQYKLLQLSQNDVGKLFNIFNAMDANGGGTIDLCELLAHIDLPRTAFTTKVFSIFDDNNSGAIDFKEFVLALWNYCTLTKGTLGKSRSHIAQICPHLIINWSTDQFLLTLQTPSRLTYTTRTAVGNCRLLRCCT